jgi:hypothetical protein
VCFGIADLDRPGAASTCSTTSQESRLGVLVGAAAPPDPTIDRCGAKQRSGKSADCFALAPTRDQVCCSELLHYRDTKNRPGTTVARISIDLTFGQLNTSQRLNRLYDAKSA